MQQRVTQRGLGDAASAHKIGDSVSVLYSITDPDVNLSLWQRPVHMAIRKEVSRLHASSLRDVRCPTSPDAFDADVCALMLHQGTDPVAFNSLRADMGQLVNLFSRFSEGRDLTFRLFTTDGDDCRRFHLDRRNLRLLCTYQGPGTEWLTAAQVDRKALACCKPNRSVIRFGAPSRFKSFWVGILRGDPDNTGRGQVHRSPPNAESGDSRVVFCLDC
ncbi:MAG: DUF1826 domain-containing protein [Halioglobus sp.]|nr:DUF1826 domain-containing protein [Halioglobus sp.]